MKCDVMGHIGLLRMVIGYTCVCAIKFILFCVSTLYLLKSQCEAEGFLFFYFIIIIVNL